MRFQCKLFWGWTGRYSSFSEVTEFYVNDKSEIDKKVEEKIIHIARTHSFDCGNLDSPLHPYVHSLEIVPIDEKETVYLQDRMGLLERESEWTKRLIENKALYKNGQYDMTPAHVEVQS